MSEANYIGEDGLLYCGVCHEPKEALWENGEAIFGSDRHPRPCRCERERQANEELFPKLPPSACLNFPHGFL